MDARPLRLLIGLVCLAAAWSSPATAFAAAPEAVLQSWSRASADARPTGRRDRQRLLEEYRGELSAHEVDVICRLSGPVDTERLRTEFHWTMRELPDGSVCLTGRPRDEVESLFYRQVEVTFNATTGLPESFRFVGHDGQPKGGPVVAGTRWRTDTPPLALGQSPQPLRVASLADLAELRPVPQDNPASRVAAVLAGWQRAAEADRGKVVRFRRLRFDAETGVEYRAEGSLRTDAEGLCHLELKPAAIGPGEASVAISGSGRPFALRADVGQSMVFHGGDTSATGGAVYLTGFRGQPPFFEESTTIDVAPLLSGFSAEATQQFFQVRLLSDGPEQFHLALRPRDAADRASLGTVEVLLDKQTLRPHAVRLLGPDSGETEVVYLIDPAPSGPVTP